jgi:peroxiredoxin
MEQLRRGSVFARTCALIVSLAVCAASQAVDVSGAAPDFTLKSAGGENLKLAELRGQVVLVNFWASWCGPCRQEMPLLDQIYGQYKALGFTVLGVNVDEDVAQANMLLKKVQVSFPVVYDSANKVSELYRVSGMPTTVIIDRDGNMRYRHEGYLPGYEDTYQQQVRTLLMQRTSAR